MVTVSEKDDVQAFKITVTGDPHFNVIKADKRSRVQDTAITAEALLPDGPYNLWRPGENARRVKDLSGAFAQLPHLPKMLKASAILDTLVDGCEQGTFAAAVADGAIWLRSGPASILGEAIPAGVLNASGKLCVPPAVIAAAEILPENLKDAWKDGVASGLSIATALSVKAGKTLPWKTVRDVIGGALQARFLELDAGSQAWPCEFPPAQFVKVKVAAAGGKGGTGGTGGGGSAAVPKMLVAVADLEPSQVQALGDIVPKLLDVKNKSSVPIRFHVRIELGDGKTLPSAEAAQKVNSTLKGVREDLQLVEPGFGSWKNWTGLSGEVAPLVEAQSATDSTIAALRSMTGC